MGQNVRCDFVDTSAAQFPAEVTKLAQSMVAQGDPVYGASCVGVGKGSMKWSEGELKALEIGLVGGFARGCHAGGITQFALGSGKHRQEQDSLCAGHAGAANSPVTADRDTPGQNRERFSPTPQDSARRRER